MLGLCHSRIVEIPFLDNTVADRIHTPSKMEKYENRIKSGLTGDRMYQTISITKKYSVYTAEATQAAKEFHKKSKSYAEIFKNYSIKDKLSERTVRKLSNRIESTACNLTRVYCEPKLDKLLDPSYDKQLAYLIDKIISERKKAAQVISSAFKRYITSLKLKKQIIVEHIQVIRIHSSIVIQKNVRRLLVRHHISVLKSAYDLIFFYDYREINEKNAKTNLEKRNYTHINNYNVNNNSKTVDNGFNENNSQEEIKIRILKEKSEPAEVKLHYTKILQMYYLPFNKKGVMRKKFKVNFVVNGKIVIDPRYEVDNDENGNFYNIIESSSFKKKNFKPNVFEFNKPNKSKFWENIFEIKSNLNKDNSSVSDISEQQENAFERLMNKNNSNHPTRPKNISETFPKKSILRNSPAPKKNKSISNKRDNIMTKKVSFNEKIEYSS